MLITLTTDFGYSDPFSGILKGVILNINPKAKIIDITHGITRHDIRQAAMSLSDSYRYYPEGSIHIVVVDPGVGTSRRPILVSSGGRTFVGPDNGVFTSIYNDYPADLNVIHLAERKFYLPGPGNTFHGRDIFAPVAALISKGHLPHEFGPVIEDFVKIDMPLPVLKEDGMYGEVIHFDTFGNAMTNIRQDDINRIGVGRLKVLFADMDTDLITCYADGNDGLPHATIGSSGRMEVFMYMVDAQSALSLKIGDVVKVAKE